MEYLSTLKDGTVVISLHVQPKASSTRFCGTYDGALKMAVTSAPVDGKANKAVIAFLSSFFQIPKKRITLISGLQSRRKRCALKGLSLKQVVGYLEKKPGSHEQEG